MPIRMFRVILASAFISTIAQGQSAYPNSLQLSGIYNSLGGSDYNNLNAGVGGELQFRHSVSAWSFGGGVQFTTHSIDDSQGIDASIKLLGLFVEPRYVVSTTGGFAPYLSGRLAVIRQSFNFGEIIEGFGDVSGSAIGVQANVGGGLLFAMSRRMNFDLGVTAGIVRFGKVSLDDESQDAIDESNSSGSNIVLRAGVSIGLGK